MKRSVFLLVSWLAAVATAVAAAPSKPNILLNHLELYNLGDDLSEKHDLAKEMPDKAAALRDQLHAWRDSVGAALPQPNPDFKGGKPKAQSAQLTP